MYALGQALDFVRRNGHQLGGLVPALVLEVTAAFEQCLNQRCLHASASLTECQAKQVYRATSSDYASAGRCHTRKSSFTMQGQNGYGRGSACPITRLIDGNLRRS